MKWVCAFVMAAVMQATAGELIAKDSIGVVVEVKEKYGTYCLDTCTVLMYHNDNFVLVHRSGASRWFPAAFHSVTVVSALSESNGQSVQPLASLKAEKPATGFGAF
jgi:hypothetical protein